MKFIAYIHIYVEVAPGVVKHSRHDSLTGTSVAGLVGSVRRAFPKAKIYEVGEVVNEPIKALIGGEADLKRYATIDGVWREVDEAPGRMILAGQIVRVQ